MAGAAPEATGVEIDVPDAGADQGPDYTKEGLLRTEPYRSLREACDVDGDGWDDYFSYDLLEVKQRWQVFSGADGKPIWANESIFWESPGFRPILNFYAKPRPEPLSKVPENVFVTTDLNGNGACDVVGYGFTKPRGGDAVLRALDGRDGSVIWQTISPIPTTALAQTTAYAHIRGAPTNLGYFEDPAGPRLVWMTADYTILQTTIPFTRIVIIKKYVDDDVHLLDARTGDGLWTTRLPYVSSQVARDGHNITRLAGTGRLTGDDHPDIVLDQMFEFHADREKDLFALALDGVDGKVLWTTQVLDGTTLSPALPRIDMEEDCEELRDYHGRLVLDATDDGRTDLLSLYYTMRKPCFGTARPTNGDFLVHVVPLSGGDGKRLWDVTVQGFGFGDSLSPSDDKSAGRIAVGVTDEALAESGAARFPLKFVRIYVLNIDGGFLEWEYSAPFALDSYISKSFALLQFYTTLAPYDWDEDGTRDLVTPMKSDAQTPDMQRLLSAASTKIDVLSGESMKRLFRVTIGGALALVAACPGAEDKLTVYAGHARRLDAIRIDPEGRDIDWRQPLWYDPRLYPTTIGIDVRRTFLTCFVDAQQRNFLGAYVESFTLYRGRGAESFHQIGFAFENGDLHWIKPDLMDFFGIPAERAARASNLMPDIVERASKIDPSVYVAGAAGLLSTGAGLVTRRARRRKPSSRTSTPERA